MLLQGKRIVVLGVASQESIAWAIAQGLASQGAEVHIAYQQRFRSRVMQLLKEATAPIAGAHRCDVLQAEEIQALFAAVKAPLHGLIHAVGYCPPETFQKPIFAVTADEFRETMAVSTHSLLSVTQAALPSLVGGSSIVSLTYLGGQRVVPHYRLMGVAKAALEACVRELAAAVGEYGVRVNAISAGPVRTLSALAVPHFEKIMANYPSIAPLRQNIEAKDVANMAIFLCSDLALQISGQILFVDAGYSALGAYSI